ncbi:MAG: hypothetical protein H7124_16570 [Phycisphaerales bacterium]|nr:hypothetical protein [Hyphomonadaceae bacterium]
MTFTPQPDQISRLWSAARAMFERMGAAIGAAASIALRERLAPEELQLMRGFLRPLELLVRQTVFIEAAALVLARHQRLPRLGEIKRLPKPLFAHMPAPPPRQSERRPSLRLWPQRAPPPARIRQLGPPVLVREIYLERAREAQSRRLNMVRFMRPPEPLRIARRIEALTRILEKPLAAARRLARKLRIQPKLAIKLATRPPVRSGYADEQALGLAAQLAFAAGIAVNDTS